MQTLGKFQLQFPMRKDCKIRTSSTMQIAQIVIIFAIILSSTNTESKLKYYRVTLQ